jgi:hypothetical protein
MAKTNLKPRKKKAPRRAPHIKRGAKLEAPTWEGWEELTGEQFHRKAQHAREWYYHNYKPVDLYPAVEEWMKQQGEEFSKEDIKAVKAAPGHSLSVTAGITAKLLSAGMPDYNEKEDKYWESLAGTMGNLKPATEFLRKQINTAIEAGKPILAAKKEIVKEKANTYQPTIQERMREACIVMANDIENFVDTYLSEYDAQLLKEFEPVKILRRENCKAGHARLIKTWYQGERDEIYDLVNFPTSAKLKKMSEHEKDMYTQLKEGYDHLSAKQAKTLLEMYQRIVDACDIISVESKAQRKPRKAKFKSADQLVKKLNYKLSDSNYGIASVPPEKIIGANIALVFNCKNRKIGLYYASNVDPLKLGRDGSGLSVKGTTLQGYNEEKSVQRTVRKTDEFLPMIKKTTKSKTEKLFQTLKTTETKLNGRFNNETVILAVF